jgi:TRAP-type transport system periplasmic protein
MKNLIVAITLLVTLLISHQTAWATTLKVATIVPEGNALYNAFKSAGAEIAAQTDGRVKFKIYPGGIMGNDAVVLRKMQQGQLHGAAFTTSGVALVDRDFQILSFPMLCHNYEELDAVRAKLDRVLMAHLEKKGFYGMGVVENGFVFMMSKQAVRGIDDLSSRKVWIPEGDPVSQMVFETAGVPPIPLQITDVLTGLQTGLIDTVSAPPVGAIVLQWFTKVKYLTRTPLLYSYGTVMFSERGWKKVSTADRLIVREVMGRYLRIVDKKNRQDNIAALQTLDKQGLTFVEINSDQMPRMQTLADNAIAKLMKKGIYDKALLQRIRSLVAEVRAKKGEVQ